MEATGCSIEALRVNLVWSTNVDEGGNNILYCHSYGLGCYKGAHSWTGGSMGWSYNINIHSNNKGLL